MADTYDLAITQGARFRRGFRWKIDGTVQSLTDYQWRAQARQKESATSSLLADFTPYLSLDPDGETLWLDLPATVTAALEPKKIKYESSWDLFIWPATTPDDAFALVQGRVSLDPSATDMSAP